MTRNGKIARLPASVRDELNRRLRDGEQGKDLVDWLNSLPKVQEVLRKEFGERPISEQNLSEWKPGGYQDWLRHQETREWVHELASQAAEIKEDAGDLSLAELLAEEVAIELGRRLHSVAAKAADDPKQVQELLDIARELGRLRRDEHSRKCLSIQRERWETDLKLKLLTLISKGPQHATSFDELARRTLVEMRGDTVKKQYADRKKRASLSAKEEAHYQQALAKIAKWQNYPPEAKANEHVLLAGVGSSDPEPFYDQT